MSELIAGRYEGFRLFMVAGARLYSIARQYEYEPGVNVATCHTGKKHDAPARGCLCGFWLYHRQARAWDQFETDLTPIRQSTSGIVSSVYGDFGLEDEQPGAVLGKVHGGGKAITGDDGARVAQVEIVTLVTSEPEALAPVLHHYGIEAIPPAPKTRGWIVDVSDNSVMIANPTMDEGKETGLFIFDEGIEVPAVGSHVVVEFERRGAMRHITHIGRASNNGA